MGLGTGTATLLGTGVGAPPAARVGLGDAIRLVGVGLGTGTATLLGTGAGAPPAARVGLGDGNGETVLPAWCRC